MFNDYKTLEKTLDLHFWRMYNIYDLTYIRNVAMAVISYLCSGSVVECLTRERPIVVLSITGDTALCF